MAPSLSASESSSGLATTIEWPSCTPINFTVTASARVSPLAHIRRTRQLASSRTTGRRADDTGVATVEPGDCIGADDGTVRGSTNVGIVIGDESSTTVVAGSVMFMAQARTSRNQ